MLKKTFIFSSSFVIFLIIGNHASHFSTALAAQIEKEVNEIQLQDSCTPLLTGNASNSKTLEDLIRLKRIHWTVEDRNIGWTQFNSDGSFVEDDDSKGTYKVSDSLIEMKFLQDGTIACLRFKQSNIKSGDVVKVEYRRGGLTIHTVEGMVQKIENAE